MFGERQPVSIPPKLREAHKLYAAGEYQEAAKIYLLLADKAVLRNIPQAPNLYFRSSAAFLKTDKDEEAKAVLIKGFSWLSERKKWNKLKKSADFTIDRLRNDNQQDLVIFVQDWISENVPDDVKNSSVWKKVTVPQDHSMRLPSNCGNCGGPVNPREVDWFDASTAVCNYCACVIRNS